MHTKGTQSFHNFHRLSPKALKGMKGKPANNDNDETKEEEEESIIEDESDPLETPSENFSAMDSSKADVITSSSVGSASITSPSTSSSSSSDVTNILGAHWIPKPRERSEVTRGIIFACEIVESAESNTVSSETLSDDLIRIRIRGQSFLLHQVLYEQTFLRNSNYVRPSNNTRIDQNSYRRILNDNRQTSL